jgi:2-furoate---CoA ligase
VTTAAGDLACDTILYVGEDAPEFADPLSSQRGPDTDVSTDVSDDDLSALLYTSGTTGEPKGVPITHEAAVARVLSNTIGQRYYMGETVLSAMPMYHTIGLHGVFSTMLCTSGTYLTQATFDPVGYVEALEAHPVTGVYEAPTIFNNVLNHDRMADADVDQVPHVIYGGAPMSSALADMVKDVFEPEHMIHLYGNTEMYDPLAYADPMKYGGQGLFHRVRVVEFGTNDPAATVERGEEGELVVHTDAPAAFDGYWRKPDETEAAVTDGWFFTGDSAYKDDEGHVMITGRADDLIISGGENIHPVEVEDVLAAHEAVADVAVVGTQDEEWGETVVAYVQPGPDADVTAAALEEWCLGRDDLAAFKRPREYQFVDDIPRNPSGKIMRYKLRERED